MAVRTTISKVKIVIATDLVDADVTAFIVSANLFINTILSGEGLSTSLLTEIETWVTAHFIAFSRERQPERIEIGGDTSEQYAKLGKGLGSTTYGLTAMSFDTTGKLANTYKNKAEITAVTSFND